MPGVSHRTSEPSAGRSNKAASPIVARRMHEHDLVQVFITTFQPGHSDVALAEGEYIGRRLIDIISHTAPILNGGRS